MCIYRKRNQNGKKKRDIIEKVCSERFPREMVETAIFQLEVGLGWVAKGFDQTTDLPLEFTWNYRWTALY